MLPIARILCHAALALSLFLSFTLSAEARCNGTSILASLQKSHPEVVTRVRAAAAQIVNTGAILWRVEKPGLPASHLFGTMHVTDKRILDMPKPAKQALAAAATVALEIDDMSPGAMMTAVAQVPQLMVYLDGTRLDRKLSATEFELVATLIAKAGMPHEFAAVMRPWLVSIMLSLPECEQRRTAAGATALDLQIANFARAEEKKLVGLETIAEQLQAMASLPDADQLAMLRVAIAYNDQREDLFETLVDAYLRRDLGVILPLTKELARLKGLEKSGFAAFNRELLHKRNATMFENSLPLVEAGNVFIAVGTAHLIGATGLVARYRKAGFTVTPVN